MKKLFILMLCIVFLLGSISAFEWDELNNKLTYSNNDLKISLDNWWGLGETIGTAELKSHNSVDEILNFGFGKEEVVMYYDFEGWELYKNGLGEIIFTDEKTGKIIQKDYSFVEWIIENISINDYSEVCNSLVNGTNECSQQVSGTHLEEKGSWIEYKSRDIPNRNIRIGLKTYVGRNDYIDGVWTIAGKKVKKHAQWTGAGNIDEKTTNYYKLDDNDLTDSKFESNGTNDGTTNISGKINSARYFDGTDKIDFQNNTIFTNAVYFSLWATTNNTGCTGDGCMIFWSSGTSTLSIAEYLTFLGTEIVYVFGNASGSNNKYTTSGAGILADQFYHIVVTGSGNGGTGRYSIFINATNQSTTFSSAGGDRNRPEGASHITMGDRIDEALINLQGIVDEFAKGNGTLSQEEVDFLFNDFNGCPYLDNTCGLPTPTINLDSPEDNANFTLTNNVTFNATIFDATNITNVTLYLNNIGNETNTTAISNGGLIGYWRLNDNLSTTNVIDSSGQGNDGTANFNTTNNSVTGQIKTALDFNGVDEFVDTNLNINDTFNGTDWTISLWVNPNSQSNSYFFGGDSAGDNRFYLRSSTTTTDLFIGIGNWTKSIALGIENDVWQNYILTLSGTTGILMRNDVQIDTQTGIGLEYPNLNMSLGSSTAMGGTFGNATIDDVRIYNRILSSTEISNIYNNGLAGFSDVNLWTFNVVGFSDGDHPWTFEACNFDNTCSNATARTFNVNTTPDIQYGAGVPVNEFNTSINFFDVNVTITEDLFQNITFDLYNRLGTLNQSVTFTNSSRNKNWTNLLDGNYSYNVTTATSTNQFNSTETRNISVDSNNPIILILAPPTTISFHAINTNLSVNWSINDSNLDTCILEYEGSNTTLTCSDNTTEINITTILNRTLTIYANDTFGNVNSSSRTWNYTIFENSQTFNDLVFEGDVETFSANITVIDTLTISTTNLFYNGTSNTGSFSSSGNDSILTIDLTVPPVDTETNITFIWNVQLSDGQSINITPNNQTITQISLDDCSVNSIVLYNYTMVDEGNQTLLSNTTIEINLNLLDTNRENFIANFTNISIGINPVTICLNQEINSTTYVVDSIVKYEADSYSIEFYNIVNSTLTSSLIPINITLFDLALADATEFRISFKGEDFVFVENALIFIDRLYISENNTFKTVELPKTDANGQTIGHFVRNDVIYNIIVIKDGEILGSFNNIIAFCTDFTIGDCQIVLEATPSNLDTFNYDEELGIIFDSVATYDNTTNAISFSFTTDDGTPKTIRMEVTRNDIFGNRSLCNSTLTSSSGTLSCSIDPNIDDTTLETNIYVNNQLAVLSSVVLDASTYGNLGFILWFFLTFIFIWVFGSSKTEVLIGLVLSFAGAISLGVTRGSIVGIGSAGIWIFVIVILGIWKLNKENLQ